MFGALESKSARMPRRRDTQVIRTRLIHEQARTVPESRCTRNENKTLILSFLPSVSEIWQRNSGEISNSQKVYVDRLIRLLILRLAWIERTQTCCDRNEHADCKPHALLSGLNASYGQVPVE